MTFYMLVDFLTEVFILVKLAKPESFSKSKVYTLTAYINC